MELWGNFGGTLGELWGNFVGTLGLIKIGKIMIDLTPQRIHQITPTHQSVHSPDPLY